MSTKKQKAKKVCLGEGEVIGHKHVLESKVDIEYDVNSTSITFMLKEMGILTHDEHDKMLFEAGVYHSYNQVEFNPMDQTISRIFD
jgi:hypothetical protein